MGRLMPVECDHGVMIDGGDFCESEVCAECNKLNSNQASKTKKDRKVKAAISQDRKREIEAYEGLSVRSPKSITAHCSYRGWRKKIAVKGDFSDAHVQEALVVKLALLESMKKGGDFVPDDEFPKIAAACREMFRSARKRKNYHLSRSDEDALIRRSSGHCELTGIAFQLENRGNWNRRPYAPSLDRINNADGYRPENCRIVCVAVNFAMNEWGEGVFRYVAERLLATHYQPRLYGKPVSN